MVDRQSISAIRIPMILALTVILIISVGKFFSFAEQNDLPDNITDSGTCGDNLTWTIDDHGLLSIVGEGEMDDYSTESGSRPWDEKSVKSVIIDQGVTSIGKYAFRDSDLESITIPNSVTAIDQYAFYSCKKLTSITIPDSVISIGYASFYNCTGLTSISLPFVGYKATATGYSALFGYIFGTPGQYAPLNTTVIEQYYVDYSTLTYKTRKYCIPSNLNQVTITGGNTLSDGAFSRCKMLTSIELPESLANINSLAFFNCTGLKNISLPDGVKNIGSESFGECSNLEKIVLPNSMTQISKNLFRNCKSLTSVTMPAGLTNVFSAAFSGCSGLTTVTLPEGLKTMEKEVFNECTGLASIIIPNSVYSIGLDAFPTSTLLLVYPDSYAESYAKDNDYKYDLTTGHTIEWTVTTKPTCTKTGFKVGRCRTCKEKISEEEVPAEGHSWGNEYIIDKDSTLTEEGSESIHCTVCNAVKEDSRRIIEKISLEKITVEEIPDQLYTGRKVEPEINVYLGDRKLIIDKDYSLNYSNNTKIGNAQVKVILSERFGNNAFINAQFRIVENNNSNPDEIGYLLSVNAGKSINKRYLSGDKVTIHDMNDVSYKSFRKWEIVYGDLSLSSSELNNSTVSFIMPESDVEIRAIYTGQSLEEEIADENNRHSAVVLRVSTLKSNISMYTATANEIKQKHGVYTLKSASEYTRLANDTQTTLSKKRQRLNMLKADTAGGHQVEIRQLEQEIRELQADYQMYLELKQAAEFQAKADSAQKALDGIDLNAENKLHEQNIQNICTKHGVKNANVDEVKYISLEQDEYDYTGKAIKPKVTITTEGGKVLDSSSYTVTYPSDCVSVGEHTITIAFRGNYTGSRNKSFTIVKHNYGDWVVVQEATCTEDGLREKVCTDCGKKDVQTIPAAHLFGSWVTTKTPTASSSGLKERECSVCGAKETEIIEKLPATVNPINQKGSDGTALGTGASAHAADAAITSMTSDNDLPGSVFNVLQFRSKKQTNKSISLSWKKATGATTYVIYGNKCGANNRMQKLAVSKGTSRKVTSVLGKKLKKGTYYKFIIVALDRNNMVVSSSKVVHVATKGGKVGNVGKVTTKVKKNTVEIKKGKKLKLSAKQKPATKKLRVKKHRTVRYESSNPNIATVTNKGVIKGMQKGTCYVYAYAQNGVFVKLKVVVK